MDVRLIRRMILLVPALVTGAWEYLRHTVLLPYFPMEWGNWLTPALVFLLTAILTSRLFAVYDSCRKS